MAGRHVGVFVCLGLGLVTKKQISSLASVLAFKVKKVQSQTKNLYSCLAECRSLGLVW